MVASHFSCLVMHEVIQVVSLGKGNVCHFLEYES